MAAVVLPLPGPVWTSSSPFSMVLLATSASCHHEQHPVGPRRYPLVQHAGRITEVAPQPVLGHDAQTDLVRHQHRRSWPGRQRGEQSLRGRQHITFAEHQVGQP
jgi:hypothetical protein